MGRWGSVTIRWGQVDADVTWLYICCGGEAWGGRGGLKASLCLEPL